MGWFLLIVVLLGAAFGVLEFVVKATAIVVLTILLTIAVLGLVAVLAIRYGWWRLNRDVDRQLSSPRRDDRY